MGFFGAEGDRQVRPEAPEGAFRLVEEEGFRGVRNWIEARLPENGPGVAGAVQKKKGPDLPGVGKGGGAVADDLQGPGGKGRDGRDMGGAGGRTFDDRQWRMIRRR